MGGFGSAVGPRARTGVVSNGLREKRGSMTSADNAAPGPVRWSLAILFAFVVVSRLAYLTSSSHSPISADYLGQMDSVIRFGSVRLEHPVTGHPLYVYLAAAVAGIARLLGCASYLVRGSAVASILCVASSVIPLYWLASCMLRSRSAGMLTAAFYTVIPLTWWFSGEAINDAMGVAFLLWAFGWLARWWSTWGTASTVRRPD